MLTGKVRWALATGVTLLAAMGLAPDQARSPSKAADAPHAKLPAAPYDGQLGFVVDNFAPAILEDADACPDGLALRTREVFLQLLPPAERERLLDPAHAVELDDRWQASMRGPNGENMCKQPELFDRPMLRTVQSKRGLGLDLDGDGTAQSCQHQEFVGPGGEQGIDNQAYRALGCKGQWRGVDGKGGEITVGLRQFFLSGQWTQVILLRGVDSLERDDDVDVIYGNTPDRPVVDSSARVLPGASFSVSNTAPRYRNVLKARIVDGVLKTQPQHIKLTQTWGQGGVSDIRGTRTRYDLSHARLELKFQPDGSVRGMLGGYEPVFNLIQSPSIGGGLRAGIDCAGELKTLKALADGVPDRKTGKCTAVSSAYKLSAVPAFVNDIPAGRSGAAR